MGWALTALGVALIIVVVAGAALALCRRYCSGWQWGSRNVWIICEEWRQWLSWLWAPREEKVGLVKAQHPTAQTVPGLYRQTGNASQHLLHSDSDLRLDAQGGFTRFEAVDRDLHPPLGAGGGGGSSTIPPQPLRPAPQPRATARPRPSPLQNPTTADYIRMQESGPRPLTPPPTIQKASTPSMRSSVFLFQNDTNKNYGMHKSIGSNEHGFFRFDSEEAKTAIENIQMTPYTVQNQEDRRLSRYDRENEEEMDADIFEAKAKLKYRQLEVNNDVPRIRYAVHGTPISDLDGKLDPQKADLTYGSYDIVQRPQPIRTHTRNDSRSQNNFVIPNHPTLTSQTILESIYESEALSQMLQAQNLANELDQKINESSSVMTPFSTLQNDWGDGPSYPYNGNSPKSQELERSSQYIESLPNRSVYETMNDDQMLYVNTVQGCITKAKVTSDCATSPIPPPPAPPDPAKNTQKNGPTTGERIFSALRSVTSQSYIDASEFYNSILSSTQQVQRLTFPSRSQSLVNDNTSNCLREDIQDIYGETDSDTIGYDESRRSSDLYSPELNLEAHRTAQEVYNSLQDPPASPLLVKDHDQDYTYLSDPSFMRTSEDIFNSLEQRKKSMEKLNGIHEFSELDEIESPKRRSSEDLYAALEEVQLKRRLSQNLEEAYISCYLSDHSNSNAGSRRGSQVPEPDPPPDEASLKRAVSCESLCSDTSVVLNDPEETPIVGHVCVGLEHEGWGRRFDGESDLAVSVLEARDLIAPDGHPAQDTFARVCLLPDRQTHVQTRIYRGCPSPSYQEKFLFPLDGGPIGRTLLVEVFSDETSMGGGASLIGEATLRLGPTPRAPATTWLPLSGSVLPTPRLGELMFSLSYLPTAERLTLVVVKARNLRGMNAIPGDFFVKVYLIQQGKKVHKKKTSIKKGDKSPIFNEAIIFNVSTHVLQDVQFRLTVAEVNDQTTSSKAYSVGHIIIGPNSVGRTLAHWRQMMTSLRRPVAMWHPLRK